MSLSPDNFDEEPDERKAAFCDRLQAFCAQHHNDLLNAYATMDEEFGCINPVGAVLMWSLIALGGSGDLDEALRRLNG